MKIYLQLSLFFLLFSLPASHLWAQSNKIKFKYKITEAKINELTAKKLAIKEKNNPASPSYRLCPNSSLKALITLKDTSLVIDPWTITKDGTQAELTGYSPCTGQPGIINSQTPNKLVIDIPRARIGDSTKVIRFHYDALIIGINSINIKFRPGVNDYKGVKHGASTTASAISLGIGAGYSRGFTSFTRRSSNNYSATLGASLGFSSVDMTKEILKQNIDVTGLGNILVLSPSVNLTLARNDIGIILAYGWDYITKNNGAWAYHDKPFFGIGIATGLKL